MSYTMRGIAVEVGLGKVGGHRRSVGLAYANGLQRGLGKGKQIFISKQRHVISSELKYKRHVAGHWRNQNSVQASEKFRQGKFAVRSCQAEANLSCEAAS